MAAIIKAGVLYESKTPLEYALGENLVAKASFTLAQINELFEMFVLDHVQPVAKKLGYKMEESEGPTILNYTHLGYPSFERNVVLAKEGKRILLNMDPRWIDVRLLKGDKGYDFSVGRHLNLEDPTFSLVEIIEEYEKE